MGFHPAAAAEKRLISGKSDPCALAGASLAKLLKSSPAAKSDVENAFLYLIFVTKAQFLRVFLDKAQKLRKFT